MFVKHLALLTAAGLGLALLSGPAFADWGSALQRLSEKAQPAVAATAETTVLAQGKYRGVVNNVDDPLVGAGSAPRAGIRRQSPDVSDLQASPPRVGSAQTAYPGVYIKEVPGGVRRGRATNIRARASARAGTLSDQRKSIDK